MDPSQLPPGSFESRVPTVIGVIALTLSIATIAVGLRIYTRKVILNTLGIDDFFAIFTLLIAYGLGITLGFMTKYGLGKHVWMMDPINLPLYLRAFYVSIVLYCAGLFAVKMTFLFQYFRVFAVQQMKWIWISAIVIVGAWALSQILIGIFFCWPISSFWDTAVQGSCIPDSPQFYINAAGNIITDVAVFLLPMPMLGKLILARNQKIILVGIFSLGFFTVAISVVRIKYLQRGQDPSWENVESSSWSLGELCSAITCSCLPTLRPLVSRYIPRLSTRFGRSSRGYKQSDRSGQTPKDVEKGWSSSQRTTTGARTEHIEERDHSQEAIFNKDENHAVRPIQHQPELRHLDSGDQSEDILGLHATRHTLSRHGENQNSSWGQETKAALQRSAPASVHSTRPSSARQPSS